MRPHPKPGNGKKGRRRCMGPLDIVQSVGDQQTSRSIGKRSGNDDKTACRPVKKKRLSRTDPVKWVRVKVHVNFIVSGGSDGPLEIQDSGMVIEYQPDRTKYRKRETKKHEQSYAFQHPTPIRRKSFNGQRDRHVQSPTRRVNVGDNDGHAGISQREHAAVDPDTDNEIGRAGSIENRACTLPNIFTRIRPAAGHAPSFDFDNSPVISPLLRPSPATLPSYFPVAKHANDQAKRFEKTGNSSLLKHFQDGGLQNSDNEQNTSNTKQDQHGMSRMILAPDSPEEEYGVTNFKRREIARKMANKKTRRLKRLNNA